MGAGITGKSDVARDFKRRIGISLAGQWLRPPAGRVGSLVEELRSHMPSDAAKTTTKKINKIKQKEDRLGVQTILPAKRFLALNTVREKVKLPDRSTYNKTQCGIIGLGIRQTWLEVPGSLFTGSESFGRVTYLRLGFLICGSVKKNTFLLGLLRELNE